MNTVRQLVTVIRDVLENGPGRLADWLNRKADEINELDR